MVDFQGTEQIMLSDLQALVRNRCPLVFGRIISVEPAQSSGRAALDNVQSVERTFLRNWVTFLVFLRDQNGFKLDLLTARKLLGWDALSELCDPQTLIGRSLQARLMHKHLLPVPLRGPDECKIAYGYETMRIARSLQSALDFPTY